MDDGRLLDGRSQRQWRTIGVVLVFDRGMGAPSFRRGRAAR
jgi:hypothetical protein